MLDGFRRLAAVSQGLFWFRGWVPVRSGAAAGVNVRRPQRASMRIDVEAARPRRWPGWPAGTPLALAEAGGGWVGRGQDKQDPANSESMT